MKGMNFGEALEELKDGVAVTRGLGATGWRNQTLRMQVPDSNSKMTWPYLYMEYGSDRVPWLPSQEDIFANDWETV